MPARRTTPFRVIGVTLPAALSPLPTQHNLPPRYTHYLSRLALPDAVPGLPSPVLSGSTVAASATFAEATAPAGRRKNHSYQSPAGFLVGAVTTSRTVPRSSSASLFVTLYRTPLPFKRTADVLVDSQLPARVGRTIICSVTLCMVLPALTRAVDMLRRLPSRVFLVCPFPCSRLSLPFPLLSQFSPFFCLGLRPSAPYWRLARL